MTPESDNPPPEREVSLEFKITAEEIATNLSCAIGELEENQILAPDPVSHPDLGDERTFLELTPAEQSHLKQQILKEIDLSGDKTENLTSYGYTYQPEGQSEVEAVVVYKINNQAYLHMRERDFFISGSPTDPNELT